MWSDRVRSSAQAAGRPCAPPLERDERVLAWARAADDPAAAVVVTTLGLWLPGRPERLGWHQIHKATWAGSRLTVVPSAARSATACGYTVMADDTPVDGQPGRPRRRARRRCASG